MDNHYKQSSGRFAALYLLFRIACMAGVCLSITGNVTHAESPRNELVFLTWSEFIDTKLLEKFERDYQIKVMQINFESDDMRDEFILKTDATGYDLIVSSGVAISQYRKHGWITKIDKSQIPNLKHINKKWRQAFTDADDYAVPYFWGTVGIAYRKDLVKEPFTSWRQLYQPAEYLRGKIAMVKYSRDIIGMALRMYGYSINSANPQELRQVEQLLHQQKPYVAAYSYISLGIAESEETSALMDGTLIAAMGYSGDALFLKEISANIEYVTPEEGTNLWVDYLAVMANAKNKDAAWKFINFLNEPEIAAQNALYLNYPSPNTAAEALLPESHLKNPIIYPDEAVLDNSEFYSDLPARAIKQRNTIFSNIVN